MLTITDEGYASLICDLFDFQASVATLNVKALYSVSISDSKHVGREENHMSLDDIPGVLVVNCQRRDEGE